MKVLIIGNLAASLVRFRGDMILDLIGNGYDVHVSAPDIHNDPSANAWFRKCGVAVHELEFNRVGGGIFENALSFFRALKVIRGINPDCLFVYTIKPVLFGLLASFILGVRVRIALVNGLGSLFSDEGAKLGKIKLLLFRFVYGLALKSGSFVFTQNSDDRDYLLENEYLVDPNKSAVVNGSGVNLNHFSFMPVASQPPVKFLMISRLLVQKGVREFVKTAEALRDKEFDVEFHLVGGLDENPDCISYEEVAGWSGNVAFFYHGEVDDVRPFLEQCHVFVLPSTYREGVPRTILEAMAVGRAIVTFDLPGCRETVIDGVNGFLVSPYKQGGLECALMNFLHCDQLAKSMGAASRALAAEKFDVRVVNKKIISKLNQLAGGGCG